MSNKIGLVLEGGGFRGLFTEGILEQFLDHGIHLPYVIGVSMGSIEGSCYVSKQKRRNYDIAMTYVDDQRYVSLRNMLTKGSMFGMEFLFKDLAYDLVPFDFKTFYASDQELVVGAMSCHSGLTNYFYKSKGTESELLKALEASCSLPFISKMVEIKGIKYLDGGVSDSIPHKKAFEDGCDKVVVILTRDKDYKRPDYKRSRFEMMMYRDYPAVIEGLKNRSAQYHRSLDELSRLEEEGKAFIIRPPKPIELGRLEKNREKLRSTYQIGYEYGAKIIKDVGDFIQDSTGNMEYNSQNETLIQRFN